MDSQAALDIIREVGQRERTSSTEMNTGGESLQSLSPRQQPFTIIVTQELKTLNEAILNLNSEVKAFSNQMMDLKLITNTVLNSIEVLFNSTKFFMVCIMLYKSNHTSILFMSGFIHDGILQLYGV
jgi:hypothetical protein